MADRLRCSSADSAHGEAVRTLRTGAAAALVCVSCAHGRVLETRATLVISEGDIARSSEINAIVSLEYSAKTSTVAGVALSPSVAMECRTVAGQPHGEVTLRFPSDVDRWRALQDLGGGDYKCQVSGDSWTVRLGFTDVATIKHRAFIAGPRRVVAEMIGGGMVGVAIPEVLRKQTVKGTVPELWCEVIPESDEESTAVVVNYFPPSFRAVAGSTEFCIIGRGTDTWQIDVHMLANSVRILEDRAVQMGYPPSSVP